MNISQPKDNYFEHRITKLEVTTDNINSTLIRIENRLDNLEKKLDIGFTRVDAKIDTLNAKVDSNFRWVVASILLVFGSSALASLLTIAAKIMHWTT